MTCNQSTDDHTELYYKAPADNTWTEIGAAETAWANFANINVEMETFIAHCFFVGHGTTDGFLPVGSLTGTTFSTTANVTSMPQGKYIKRYRDRLYVANAKSGGTEYPFRVYFSSVPSAGAITWTVASDFLDVDFGRQITGLGSNWDKLMVFTEDSAYLYDQSQFKKVWSTGCSNHRTIVNHGAYTFWCSSDGIWTSTGGQPQNISGPVIDYIRNGTPSNFFATIVDEEYCLYVGNVTVNGISYANCELVFNVPTSSWRTRENFHNMTMFARYSDSGKMRRLMGTTTGAVYNKGKYTDTTLISADDSNAIGANFELAPIHLEDLANVKRIGKLHAYAERAQALKLKARVIDRNARILTPYKPLGELTGYVNSFDIDVDKGVLLQIAGSEVGTSPYFSFYGFELELFKQSDILKNK